MRFSQLVLLILNTCLCNFSFSQTIDDMSAGIDIQEETTELSAIEDNDMNLRQRKFKINLLSELEIQEIPYLDQLKAKALYQHIKEYGAIEDMQELQTIDGFDLALTRQVAAYIDLTQDFKGNFKTMCSLETESRICMQNSIRLEKSKAYLLNPDDPNRYQGDRFKRQLRASFKKEKLFNMGLTYKKDAGETYNNGYISGFAYLHFRRALEEIILGDFTCQFGQGMHMGSGLSINKSTLVGQSIKISRGFNPYRSGSESGHFRGLGMKVNLKSIRLYVLGSIIRMDTKKEKDSISSIVNPSGYYRNIKEMANHNKARFVQGMIRIEKSMGAWRSGISFSKGIKQSRMRESMPIIKQNSSKLSLDYLYHGHGLTMFGETMMEANGKFGSSIGGIISINQFADLQFSYRHYSNALNLDNNASLKETGNGEKGMYLAYNQRLSKYGTLNAYLDFYRLENYSNLPFKNKETRIEYLHEKHYGHKLSIRYSQKDKSINDEGWQTIGGISKGVRVGIRLHLEYPLGRNLRVYHRLEQSSYKTRNGKKSTGYLSYHEISLKISRSLKIYGRFTRFETDDYDSRLYAYEHDISFTYTNKAYYGKGQSYYLMLNCKVNKILNIKLRFAAIKQTDRESLGSGLDSIDGNTAHDIRLEIEFKI